MQNQFIKIHTYLNKKGEKCRMDKRKLKDEAARRMKTLELYDAYDASIIRTFINDNAVFVSLPAMGNRIAEVYPLTDEENKMVKKLEEDYGVIAYHVIRNEIEANTAYSVIYSIFYVSDKETEWETECEGFQNFSSTYIAYPKVYTWDTGRTQRDTKTLTSGTGSFCTITVTAGSGGLCRQG